MDGKSKKSALKSKEPTANQKISEALQIANDRLDFYESIGDGLLKKTLSHYVEIRKLSPTNLKKELIEALCEVEKITMELEIHKEAFATIQLVIDAAKQQPRGGRPIHNWAVFAFNCAKKYKRDKGKLPSAEILRELVSSIAESRGQFGEPNNGGVFSEEAAKQYLKYFKNNLTMFEALEAEHWFFLFEGRFKLTKI